MGIDMGLVDTVEDSFKEAESICRLFIDIGPNEAYSLVMAHYLAFLKVCNLHSSALLLNSMKLALEEMSKYKQ